MLHFDNSTIDNLRSNILPIVGRDVVLKQGKGKYAGEWRGPCPFCHDGNDRFAVFTMTKLFNCRICGRKGDAIAYTMARRGLPFVDAVKLLAGPGGVDAFPPATIAPAVDLQPNLQPMTKAERGDWQEALEELIPQSIYWLLDGDGAAAAARAWLESRGITGDLIRRHGLGYNDHWRPVGNAGHKLPPGLLIPRIRYGAYEAVNCYVDRDTRERYTVNRMFLKGSNPHTWLHDLPVSLARVVLIVEGELDAVLLARFLLPLAPSLVVTTLGGATIQPDALALAMLEGKRVILAFDNDVPGIAGEQRLQALIPGAEIAPKLPTGKDVTDFYKAGGNISKWLDTFLECPII